MYKLLRVMQALDSSWTCTHSSVGTVLTGNYWILSEKKKKKKKKKKRSNFESITSENFDLASKFNEKEELLMTIFHERYS